MKILIVDDQTSVHLFFDKVLNKDEFDICGILHAYNGEEAYNIIQNDTPELMFLDIEMPVMNGIQLLKHLSEHSLTIKTIVLSAYNEFDYARSCIKYGVNEYLLKPIDIKALKEILLATLTEMNTRRQTILLNELTEAVNHPASYEALYLSEYLPPDSKSGIAFACCLNGNTIVSSGFINVSLLCAADTNDLSFYLYSVTAEEDWRRFADYLIGESFGIGLSRFALLTQNAMPLLQEAEAALEQSFYHYGANIYNPNCFKLMKSPLLASLGDKIREAYSNQDISNIKHYFHKLFHCFEKFNISPEFVRNFCENLLFQLDDDFTKAFLHLKGSSFSTELKTADSVTLKNTYLRIVLNMLADVGPENAKTDTDIVIHIKDYVDTHFDNDLSLDTLSTHFFISKYQISRLFKKVFQINFSDYILQVRMKNAAEYLLHTDLKLYDISKRVGYEETSYFSNVFKKYYGAAPSDYKQLKGEKNYGESS